MGREEILSRLRRALDDVRRGQGACVVIEGAAGIGKSRVLDAVVAEAGARDFVVARTQACELNSLVPARALRELFEAGGPLHRVDGLESLSFENDPRILIAAVRARIEGWARRKPVLVALDDAHWADEVTALMLRVLVDALADAPVMWLLTRRPAPAGGRTQASIDHLLGSGANSHVLGPISPEAAAEMCADLLGAEPDSGVLELVARCDGNPFLLEGLLTAARTANQVRIVAGKAVLVAAERLPRGFVDVVEQYLLPLSDAARRMLSAASVLGRPFTVHEVAFLTGGGIPESLMVSTEAIRTAILVGDGAKLEFRHDLIRDAVYAGLPSPVRSALHREVASAARREARSPAEAAEHLVRSGYVAAEDGADILQLIVRKVGPAAPNTAADLIVRMLEVLGADEAAQATFVAEAVRLLVTAGRVAEAIALAEERLLDVLDNGEQAELLLAVSEALHLIGSNSRVVEYTTRALTTVRTPAGPRADLLAIQANGLIGTRDFGSADRVAVEAIECSAAGRSTAAYSSATVARSMVARVAGELGRSLTLAREAVRIADEAGDTAMRRHPRLGLCQVLMSIDQFDDAEAECARGQRDADRLGMVWPQPFYQLRRAEMRMAAGLLEDARKDADQALGTAQRINSVGASVLLMALLARLFIQQADVEVATDYLRRADELRRVGHGDDVDELAWALVELHDATGRPDLALDQLVGNGRAGPDSRLSPALLVHEPRAAPWIVRLALRTGRIEDAEAAVECARTLAERNPGSTSFVGCAMHADGLLRDDNSALTAAIGVLETGPRPLATAAAVEDLAVAEHSTGSRPRAWELMTRAKESYEIIGTQIDIERIRDRMSRFGTDGRSKDESRTKEGWTSLTPAELRVIRLVAHGRTNREIASELRLSPHTIDSHLRRCFAKLGVSSRVDLTRHVLARETGRHGIA